MNLAKLFEMQKALDEHILDGHPELKGQNNLDWKILALQVELGECANEWRGFKKWSKDQTPRTHKARAPYVDLEDAEFYNPLLEEYVDCLHFILSIGLELNVDSSLEIIPFTVTGIDNVTMMFNQIYACVVDLYWNDVSYLGCMDYYIELLHNFLKLGEMLGFRWEQVEQAYYSKNAVNHARQINSY